MNKKVWWQLLFGCMLALGFTACSDDDDDDDFIPVPEKSLKGVFILNEGSYGNNNASVTYYDKETDDSYLSIVGDLGDTGQDILIYGSRLYIAVSGSEYISVIDLQTKREVSKIANLGGSPRYLASHGGKVYASVYNVGVVQIDTLDYSFKTTGDIGKGLEGIAVSGSKLYVAVSNAGEYNPDKMDNRVAVVNLPDLSLDKHITVNKNPYYVQADASGNVYVSSQDVWNADYSVILSSGKLQRIHTATGEVTDLLDKMVLKFIVNGDQCYFFDYAQAGVLNLTSREVKTNSAEIGAPYGIGLDPSTNEIYLSGTDYKSPGKVYVFSQEGKLQRTIDAGINPNGFAFYY